MQDRPRVWILGVPLTLPVAGLVLLLAVPSFDVTWEHHPSHFLLVLAVALINVALALIASEAAHQRADGSTRWRTSPITRFAPCAPRRRCSGP